MKRSLLLLVAALLAAAAPLAPARADDSVPIDFVYDALSPYGDWIYTPNYGYVWEPLASQQPGWAPYSDGSWAFTDAGWTWISNEDFGWLTYHYGRWIRLIQGWVWVPGNQWAPAWVSWRQTQGQIGWAPLPPEAAWSPGVGFGGWTDGYYDIGPAYYNFVPIGMFASQTTLRPYILDRSRNFTFYDQSVNVTHTSYRPNVMNHIFVGGPDPQRIDGLGSNHVRRLTLRHDDEGFRRNWLDRSGGAPQRNAGNPSRIEQGQFFVAAPTFRPDASHAFPSRVREPLHQPEVDRGWRGGKDEQHTNRLRELQRDELARSRPANLPEKKVLPATSTAPPPAFGRVLNPEERLGRGGPAAVSGTLPSKEDPLRKPESPPHIPATPKNPLPPGGPPGIPPRDKDEPGTPVTRPDRPRHEPRDKDEGRPSPQRPGLQPNQRPGVPQDPPTNQPQVPSPNQRPSQDRPQVPPQSKRPSQDRPQVPPQSKRPSQDQPPGQRRGPRSDNLPGSGGPGAGADRPGVPFPSKMPKHTPDLTPPTAAPQQSNPPANSMTPRQNQPAQPNPPGNSHPERHRGPPPGAPPSAPGAFPSPPGASPGTSPRITPPPMPNPQQPPPVRTLPPQSPRPPQMQPQAPQPAPPTNAPPHPDGGRPRH